MKKLVLLLSVFALVFTSCSSDDDGNENDPSQDQILGTWNYYQSLVNGVDLGLLPCEIEENIIFNTDGTFIESFYDQDLNGDCSFDVADSGSWTSLGNNRYSLVYTGDTESYEHFIEGNFLYYQITFDNATPNDTSDDITETEVYIKQ